jgi:positive regulator of sigma E activity
VVHRDAFESQLKQSKRMQSVAVKVDCEMKVGDVVQVGLHEVDKHNTI